MKPVDELELYKRDRPQWIKAVAPVLREMLPATDPLERNQRWAGALPDLKLAVLDGAKEDVMRMLWRSTSLADMAEILQLAKPEMKRVLWDLVPDAQASLRRYASEQKAAA